MNNHSSASSTPIVSPLDIAFATSAVSPTSHLSMNQTPFHPYSPVVAASPSVAFSNLSLRTPHRTIPAALPPTPKLTGASPQISTPSHAFVTPELPSAPLPTSSSTNPKAPGSLRSNYKKMRRESNANNRRTEMLPPSDIPVQSPLQPLMSQQAVVMEDWVDFTTFMQEVGNGTPPMVDSHSPGVGTGPLPMSTTPVLGGAEETWDLLKMIDPGNGNDTLRSPTIQQPLDSTTPFSSGHTSGFQQSPAVPMPDDLSAYFNNAVAGPSSGSPSYSDVLSSPTHVPSIGPSPRVPQWHEFPLFGADPSPPVNPKTFTPVSSGAPNLSQESVSSSASGQTSNSLSAPPQRAPSMSPSMSKRPRLSLDGLGHRRNPSSSSSAAPSPYIGAGSVPSSTKPTGYRRHLQPTDLTPLDAPTQKRNYAVPSVTSRKEYPPSVTKSLTSPSPRGSKRTSAAAGLPTRDDAEQMDRGGSAEQMDRGGSSGSDQIDTDDLKQAIEEKRRANTIAARKSRLRKAEFLSGLQLQIKELEAENDQLRQRAETAEQRAEIAEQQLRQYRGY